MRTVPLAGTFRRFPRLVRDIADKLGKDVEFVIDGQDVEADKTIVDGLFEPLLHVIRNALDHGIEAAEKRQAMGKPLTGRVTLQARREIERIVVIVSDDGGGIDTAALRKAAGAQGVAAEATADAHHEAATAALIFTPGISTSANVTEISGRGVGMDAVRTAVELLRWAGRYQQRSRRRDHDRHELAAERSRHVCHDSPRRRGTVRGTGGRRGRDRARSS